MSEALSIRGLVKHYPRGLLGRRDPVAAVDDVDLVVRRGEVVALVGESGSGKTTLARCALALLRPDAGRIEVLGTDIQALSGHTLDNFRRRVQPLFQDPSAHLNPGLRVQEILAETARLHRPDERRAPLLDEVLDQVGMGHRRRAFPHELSGGERRRVGIARLLLCRPELVIADEPTAGLDAARKAEIMELMLRGEPADRATLLISHDLPLVAAIAHRIIVMVGGRVVERMDTSSIASPIHHPYTAELLAASGLRGEPPPVLPHARGADAGSPGCPLFGRCTLALSACARTRPLERAVSLTHRIACHAMTTDSDRTAVPPHPPGAAGFPR